MNCKMTEAKEMTDEEFSAALRKVADGRRRGELAHEKGAAALDRLLNMAETRNSGQIRRIALFIGACWNGERHFDFFDLRAMDDEISDDMLALLDAIRWGVCDIDRMVPDGQKRVEAVLALWGMYGDGQSGQPMVAA